LPTIRGSAQLRQPAGERRTGLTGGTARREHRDSRTSAGGRHGGLDARRSALVSGAARGIGRAIAERLGADGLAVSVADLPSAGDAVAALVAELTGAGVACLPLALDVADPDAAYVTGQSIVVDGGLWFS
jgi:hypothetical protein